MIGQVQIIVSGAAMLSILNIVIFAVTRFRKNGAASEERRNILETQRVCMECLQKLSDNAIRQTAILENIASRIE